MIKSPWVFIHEKLTTGVHGVGSNYVAQAPTASHLVRGFSKGWTSGKLIKGGGVDADPTEITPNFYVPGSNALSLFIAGTFPTSLFTAKINAGGSGGLTATNVPYDGDSGEGFIDSIQYASMAGKMILWNTTRATSRVITAVDAVNNKITTESSTDAWADNDDITTQSQTNTTANYFDIDISALVSATSVGVAFQAQVMDTATGTYYAQWHPYETYAAAKAVSVISLVANQWTYIFYIVPVISQKITMMCVASGAATFSAVVKFLGSIDVI